jgi:CBS domain-containing protein
MRLSNLFTKKPITAEAEEALASVAQKMQEHNVGTVVVVEQHRPVGIITDRDLALALGARGISAQAPVQQVMTRHVLAIPDETSILAATQHVKECHVRRLPIVDREDHLVGMVTLDDLLRCLGRELYNLTEGIEGEMKIK